MQTWTVAAVLLLAVTASADRSLLQGSTPCPNDPATLWACCVAKTFNGDDLCAFDALNCDTLTAGADECRAWKGSASPVVGGDCASRGPENLAACCVEIPTDPLCVAPSPGPLVGGDCASRGPENLAACCVEIPTDPLCVAPSPSPLIGGDCASRGPENLAACCVEIPTDPLCVAPTPSPAEGGQCATTGPANWWYCCQDPKAVSDPTCPPPACGELTTAIADCCQQKGGWTVDPTCATRVCFNMEQTEQNMNSVIDMFNTEVAGENNVTVILEQFQNALYELNAIFQGDSQMFPSTIVS